MKPSTLPLTIAGHDVLGAILRRNAVREKAARLGVQLRTHTAQLGEGEHVESNLPLRSQPRVSPKPSEGGSNS